MEKYSHSLVFEHIGNDQDSTRITCEWDGCYEDGVHRAPRSREEPNKFSWFCKSHAAQYNKAWNFFADMTEEEVEAIVRYDTVWNRPSWPMGTGFTLNAFMRGDFADPFNFFKTQEAPHKESPGAPPSHSKDRDLKRALAVFGLKSLGQESVIKQRYKELVKRHHPDVNGAVEISDDRIKEINHAYKVILEFFAT